MAKQLIFSKKAVADIRSLLNEPNGDERYLSEEPFARSGFDTLESPSIESPVHLVERVNPQSDVDTAIALYEAFKCLNALEASSVGFWTYLAHVDLWKYMKARFPLEGMPSERRKDVIRRRWILNDPSQQNLIHHPLAGLWWGVKLSVDETRGEERYDFTRILYRNLDLPTRTLGTYQLGRLPKAIRGILGYVFDHEDDFKNEYEAKMRHIMKHFNSMGGVLQLGCLDESFYREELDRSRDEWIKAKKKTGEQRSGLN